MNKTLWKILLLGGYFILILLVASIINDLFFFIFKETSNNFIFAIPKIIIIAIFIELTFKYSDFGKEVEKTLKGFIKKVKRKL